MLNIYRLLHVIRAWYRFYSRVFNTRYGIKNEWIKTIWLLTCHNLFITYHMPHLGKFFLPCSCFRSLWETQKYLHWRHSQILKWHFDKTAKQIFPPNLTPGNTHQLKYNVQPDWSNQIISFYLIGQFQPSSDMISFHCSGVSFLVMALSHWYPHIICNKKCFSCFKLSQYYRNL